jgi:hypothetical protein
MAVLGDGAYLNTGLIVEECPVATAELPGRSSVDDLLSV